MTISILFVALLFCLWIWICYLITKFIVGIIVKLINPTFSINTIAVFVVSLFVAGLSIYLALFTTPARNYKTAYIEKQQIEYKVTVKGKRVLMSHDPVSALLGQTYEDSISFLIPRQKGVIQSDEIQIPHKQYKPIGTISIDQNELSIKLYYDNEETDPDTWNGKYRLQFR